MGRFVRFASPRNVIVVAEEDQEPTPSQVRIATLFSGISAGTELSYYRGTNPHFGKSWDLDQRVFRPLGEGVGAASLSYPVDGKGQQEVGVVVEVGAEVDGVVPGDIVWGKWGHRSSAVKSADYVRPRRLPAGANPVLGVFSQIGATALNIVLDADIHVGETVAVFGLGVLGQITAQLARLNGADVIAVDPHDSRLKIAEAQGAAHTLNANSGQIGERIHELTGGRGVDVALEVTGSYRALHEAVRSASYSARVVASGFFQGEGAGLALGEEFHHNRIEIKCSQASGVSPQLSYRWNDERLQRTVMDLAVSERLRLEPLVTDVVPVERAAEAFDRLDRSRERVLQSVLRFEEGGK
ncbi:zinc-binding alcohol dehydrogenase [Streptomyces parvus]|uniref:Zinc-binding alcohol dehydrogenase n=1 Tax=Streptomyces sp. JL1001 TaxID=3078227 RepID=A0AAU8KJN8_9ACTN|nr:MULTISPECIES: zinc-binding alcohol dehydrogenase [unclassified Streptomyces]PJN35134.1 oxidoreductase [Streptomyces sp. CB02613]SCD97724.1 Threonine dehydrogenase [Streptomyces sp. Termitarium-T10T-6]